MKGIWLDSIYFIYFMAYKTIIHKYTFILLLFILIYCLHFFIKCTFISIFYKIYSYKQALWTLYTPGLLLATIK